mmetsp:Transcript_45074/g.109789  ORF Transcript_45074/g.109789 Transcript_45074/m.109789 type:complete len:117 (+) Transcript_45074:256-606(+)
MRRASASWSRCATGRRTCGHQHGRHRQGASNCGKHGEALAKLEEGLAIQTRALGSDEDKLSLRYYIADEYRLLGSTPKAKELFRETSKLAKLYREHLGAQAKCTKLAIAQCVECSK